MRIASSRFVAPLWLAAAALSFWSFGYTSLAAGDLWWHLANGREIVESGALPRVDAWSFTRAGAPWLQHEWLSDLLFQLWASAFGRASLVYWKWGVVVAAFTTLLLACRRVCGDWAASYLATLLAAAVAAPFLDIRPHLYSLLGYALLLWVASREGRPLPLWLPALFLVWANLHGGFFFGLMVVAVLAAVAADRRRGLLVLGLCALTSLVNPSGYRAFLYPLRYALDRDSVFRAVIGEWAPPFKSGGIVSAAYPFALAAFALAALLLLARRESPRRAVAGWIGLGLLTMAMSLTSRRLVPLFAMSMAIPLALAFVRLSRAALGRLPPLAPAAAAVVVGTLLVWPYPKGSSAFHYLTAEDEFPVEVANFIETNGLAGDVLSYYTWGGYLHLRTGGRMRVFIDQRADTVFDEATLDRYRRFQRFDPGWQEVLASSGADYVLWPRDGRGRPLAELVRSGRWRLLYDDAVSVLMVRSDRAPAAPLRPTPESGHKHLALGEKSLEEGRFDVAERELERADALLPASRFTCRRLADLELARGRPERAAERERACAKRFPTSG